MESPTGHDSVIISLHSHHTFIYLFTNGRVVGVVEGQAPGVDTVDTPGVSGADNSVLLNVLYSGQVADL